MPKFASMPSTPRQVGASRVARRRRLVAALAVGAAFATLLGLAYVAARETSLFAVRTVDVAGAQPAVADAVHRTLAPLDGTSLVALSPSEIEQQLEAIPDVRSARVDRQFPHELVVTVTQERPVAVVRLADGSWLVAASGRVLGDLELGEYSRLPRIWLAEDAPPPEPGARLTAAQGAGAARAVAELPAGFPARVQSVRGTADDLLLILGGRTELRLGPATDIRRKLEVAATVLEDVRDERLRLAYLDVSLPERPVGAPGVSSRRSSLRHCSSFPCKLPIDSAEREAYPDANARVEIQRENG